MRLIAAALALALGGCAGAPALRTGAAVQQQPAVIAQVVRDGGAWTVTYRFTQASPVWAFPRSATPAGTSLSWRAGSWTVLTPGVRLERRGWYDVLVADTGGVPAEVRIRFTPYAGELQTSYDPALAFSDGSIALFDGQFDLFPVASAEAAARLPLETAEIPEANAVTRTTFRDAGGQVLHAGSRQASVTLAGAGAYVLFGPARPIVTAAMAAILDPALPEWLRTFLSRATPDILARYASVLGAAPGAKPTIMVSWAGPTPHLVSMGGSVLPGLVTMRFEGEGVLRENAELRNQARWFIAHEGAHFWLGQAVAYQYSRDAWITEGGADLLAIRTVQALDPGYDWRAMLNHSIADCASLTKDRGVATAEQRSEQRAYYACGAVFGLVVEAQSHQPFSSFVRHLIESNRADRQVTRTEWLDAFSAISRDPTLRTTIEGLIDHGDPAPGAAIASLLRRAGIDHVIGADGVLMLR